MHTATFKTDNQQGPTVQHTGNSTQCYVAAWMVGVWGRMDTGICTAESLGCCHNTVNQLCANIKLKVKKKKGGITQLLVTITFTKRSNRLGWIIESGLRPSLLNTLFLLKHQI